MPHLIPIGVDDFRALREGGMEYVDKSLLIREVLDKGADVVLLPRPRRFGKTLGMTMLRCYFEKRDEDLSHLFSDLAIWQAGDAYRAHFQQYPVIFLSFKAIKLAAFEDAWGEIRLRLSNLFKEHRALLDGDLLDEQEKGRFQQVLAGTANINILGNALLDLSGYLHRAHGERVVLLIDEYDAPIHSGVAGGYVDKVLDFFRLFLTQGLKGNPHLFKAVLTGILRVATESLFSGFNNLAVYTLLRPDFSTCFGFTEPEVVALLTRVGRAERLRTVRAWYNGYDFGGTVIYNPWSILCYIDGAEPEPRPFWVSTSSNDLLKESLIRHAAEAHDEIESLLEGRGVLRQLDENVVLADLASRVDTLFGLLTFSGYLRAEKRVLDPEDEPHYLLSIPNREVRGIYATTFRDWMTSRVGGLGDMTRLKRAILSGDAEILEEQLTSFTAGLLSYHDTARRPEQVYHAFVIGLLAALEPDYLVRSNRESGKGRPDVTIRPKHPGNPGVVLELKVARPGKKTLEQALAEGTAQIRDGDYTRELLSAGATPVHAFAVAFDGKEVRVVSV